MSAAASFRSMKASIGFFAPSGTAGRTGLRNAHQVPAGDRAPAVHTAPASIQSLIAETSFGVSEPPGGIETSPACATALYRRLSADLPGTIAGPRVPPLSRVSRAVTLRPE